MNARRGALRFNPVVLRVLLLVGAVALVLAAAELGLVLYHEIKTARSIAGLPPMEERVIVSSQDADLMFEFKPGASVGDFTVNSLGMADGETSLEKSDHAFRIAVVGDSISANFAAGTPTGEFHPRAQNFQERLEMTLAESPQAGPIRSYEVLNFGVNGYSISQVARMATTRARQFDPDVVIAQLCLNDPFTRQRLYSNAPPIFPTRLVGFVSRRLWPQRSIARAFVDSRYTEQGWKNVREGLRDLADLSKEVPVLAVLVPYLDPNAYEDWEFQLYHDRIAEIAREVGLPLLDLRLEFEAAGLIDAKPGVDPIHPGPEGHALMAKRIRSELEALGMLPQLDASSVGPVP